MPKYHKRETAARQHVRNIQRYAIVHASAKSKIERYCADHNISVSEFLSTLVLRQVTFKGHAIPEPANCTDIPLDYTDKAKLDYQSMVLGITPAELIKQALIPFLNKQKIWSKTELATLRYWVNAEEDESIRKYVDKYDLWPRHFAGLLATRVAEYYLSGAKERRRYPWL
jgi:hypothetical protein